MTATDSSHLIDKSAGDDRLNARAFSGQSKGFEEQWLRQLEKANTEKQMAAMTKTAQPHRSNQGAVGRQSSAETVNAIAIIPESANPVAHSDRPGSSARHMDNFVASTVASLGKSAADVPSVRSMSLGLSLTAMLSQPTTRVASGEGVASSRAVTPFVGLLPETSSVRTLLTDDGAHVVIRDGTLGKDQVLNVVKELAALVATGKQRLWAITLNGERIWQRTDSEGRFGSSIDTRMTTRDEEAELSLSQEAEGDKSSINRIY
ncbi:MAG: hypothetical protein V3T17_12110 [Pseudomonadales bacterium]